MEMQDSLRGDLATSTVSNSEFFDLGALFDGHIAREFADFDVDATMKTMVPEPYVHCVPIMTGVSGGQGVRRFYSEHFINQIPKDAKVTPISRTIGKDQVVDELIVSFTHNTQWDYLLPGIPPTGKKVEIPHVVVMEIRERESRARARLVGPGIIARASGPAGSGENASGRCRAGQKASARCTRTQRAVNQRRDRHMSA